MTMSSAAVLPQDALPQPLQFKGEIMDFDLAGLEVDHRKRRRNRTTQSCLNCHTSKRKCDRKRPCQRCIQLGLTGLCVYEVDDPALRDDPNIDENTRLRNRIAELESLVRELRGKPHPKWAEPNFCDGDANEKWHSRSSRRLQYQKLPRDRHDDGQHLQGANGRGPPAIKTEQANDPSQQNLYRFTPSPTHPTVDGSSGHSYGLYRQQAHGHGQGVYSPADDSSCYSSPSSASVMTYSEARHGAHGVTNGEHYYQQEQAHQQYVHAQTPPCPCLTNPAAGNALIGLTTQLQNTAVLLRQLPEHNTARQTCAIVRRVTELTDIMHGNTVAGGSSYEGLSTPTETELSMSPISTSSQSSMGASAPGMHEQWPGAASMAQSAAGYDSYFPVAATQPEHAAVFHKTYHIS
ncbi:transcription factor [Ganoderma sinense ZZ0214-1]|uniref:Transcription factor n=1 Tax=Ganoderma sinense ZZ0214-1 TaxID=1077348 RepID=A0A2G8RMG3_9APHY|nr:transcription factor [Ganoderma sinense ZZ0214-1]